MNEIGSEINDSGISGIKSNSLETLSVDDGDSTVIESNGQFPDSENGLLSTSSRYSEYFVVR